jgi:acylphosphatase
MPMGVVCAAWKVRGIVQGVGFRYFTLRHAQDLALAGWVRNLDDGSVEVAVRGSDETVARLREILLVGPRLGRVDRIEDLPTPSSLEALRQFTIE